MKKIIFSVAIAVIAVSCSKKETATESNSMVAEPETKTITDSTQRHIVDQGNEVAKSDSTAVIQTVKQEKKETPTENKKVETTTTTTTTTAVTAPEKK